MSNAVRADRRLFRAIIASSSSSVVAIYWRPLLALNEAKVRKRDGCRPSSTGGSGSDGAASEVTARQLECKDLLNRRGADSLIHVDALRLWNFFLGTRMHCIEWFGYSSQQDGSFVYRGSGADVVDDFNTSCGIRDRGFEVEQAINSDAHIF